MNDLLFFVCELILKNIVVVTAYINFGMKSL